MKQQKFTRVITILRSMVQECLIMERGCILIGGYCGCRGDFWQIVDVHELGMWDIWLQYIVWQLSMKLTVI